MRFSMKRLLVLVLALLAPSLACAQAVVVSACGTKTFTVGTTNYVTMNPQGYLCVSPTTTTATGTEVNSPVPAEEPTPKEKLKK